MMNLCMCYSQKDNLPEYELLLYEQACRVLQLNFRFTENCFKIALAQQEKEMEDKS